MFFTELIGPYEIYLDFKFHHTWCHKKYAAVIFHNSSYDDNSNFYSGLNNTNTNRYLDDGVVRIKAKSYFVDFQDFINNLHTMMSRFRTICLNV